MRVLAALCIVLVRRGILLGSPELNPLDFRGQLHSRHICNEFHHGTEACARACACTKKKIRPSPAARRCATRCRRGSRVAYPMAQRRLDAIMAPRVRALLASATCWMCCHPMGCSIPSGVPGAAGWSYDTPRGHERATTSWACFGRGRWELLIDVRARRRHR